MDQRLQVLGEAVKARRAQLDLTQEDVNQGGGPSDTTLTRIENGEGTVPAPSTLRKLDHALQWEQGSARRVLDGGEPKPLEGGQSKIRSRGFSSSGSDPIDDYLAKLADDINDRYGNVVPPGYIPVPLAAVVAIALQSEKAESQTGIAVYQDFDDIDESEYDSMVSEVEDLEQEVLSLTSELDDFLTTHVFHGDPVFLRRLRKFIANSNRRRQDEGKRRWKYSDPTGTQPLPGIDEAMQADRNEGLASGSQ
ncbi:helix-turn-helix transcriptional regulator [Rhodococcus sp. IEGM 1366]|uniref:helix-turn-helix domain-containing protein n=1 Tax=Rhodococcus sp. IEGM 1366 TaxID=3082223 RepID=UPI002952A464|nr:helix-turn-helix transcriptional regulator [Rhodococcus sp. IEGM 1366]MDV8066422.1 helix-turn-helix transcriptional regulator [Rhodococcus sp. IEGM 1366]